MKFQGKLALALLILSSSSLAKADVTRAELKNHEELHVAWVVNAPIQQVFEAYKEYSEVHWTPSRFLWAAGGKTEASIGDGEAEITVRLQNNPFSKGVFFLVELHQTTKGTRVDYWYTNGHWRKNGEDLRRLLKETPARL